MSEPKTPSKRLFIGSLPYRFTEGELLGLFVAEGKIISVKIINNQWGKSRGMGYVEFENLSDAMSAKEKFHNFRIADRTIIVDYAQPDPFLTPEGQARHVEAVENRKSKTPGRAFEYNTEEGLSRYHSTGGKPFRPSKKREEAPKPELRFKPKGTARQTIFESRNFGSRIGAKFASRNKKRK